MRPQINEDLLAAIFVETDDLFQSFQRWALQHPFARPVLSRSRKPRLSPAEVATIVTAYHLSGYKCFEYYYRELILGD